MEFIPAKRVLRSSKWGQEKANTEHRAPCTLSGQPPLEGTNTCMDSAHA